MQQFQHECAYCTAFYPLSNAIVKNMTKNVNNHVLFLTARAALVACFNCCMSSTIGCSLASSHGSSARRNRLSAQIYSCAALWVGKEALDTEQCEEHANTIPAAGFQYFQAWE